MISFQVWYTSHQGPITMGYDPAQGEEAPVAFYCTNCGEVLILEGGLDA